MAQRVHVVLEDDLDGGSADETVMFGVDGVNYEIDLSESNAARLREVLAPYIAVARRSSSRGRKSSTRGRSGGSGNNGGGGKASASEIRTWARAHGYEVSERGRVPAEVKAAYEAAS